jgi:DNA invertase Pin-like site-specific DNA recombinase
MTPTKRVACLYRVSTKKQLDDAHIQDIPMQRKACMEFIDKHDGWQLVKEYTEPGISGYKTKTDNREQLIQAKHDAENGLFDILLVYMFDRLGRRQEETPFVLEYFDKLGIEVWSAVEGQQKFEQHVDSLINFIRFWQAEGESKKTSVRVDTKHRQMVQEGQYRGGVVPFGYKAVPSGKYNKDGKELLELQINEEEADTIRLIFDLIANKGYGALRIANYLNQHGMLHNGNVWIASTITYIIRNPIYKGQMSYNKSTKKDGNHRVSDTEWVLANTYNPQLQIVTPEIFDKAQLVRQSHKRDAGINTPTKSPLLLTGFIYCGYCGKPMTVKYRYRQNKSEVRYKTVYACMSKATRGADACPGQYTYSKERIERPVLEEVFNYVNKLKNIESKSVDNPLQLMVRQQEKEINKLIKQNEENEENLSALRKEIGKALLGKSKFDPDTLSVAIQEQESAITDINNRIADLQSQLEQSRNKLNNMDEFANIVTAWEDKFNRADVDTQKAMLAFVVDKIVVYKDNIDITLNMDIEKYMETVGVQNYSSCPPIYHTFAPTLTYQTVIQF